VSQNPTAAGASASAAKGGDPKSQLRRVMGFWDVLLFNIGAVLGPRWIAAAAHNGTSSISLWVLAALFFFLPTTFVIVELSTRFPEEGGLYVWSKEAFGDFHGFIAGWTYWVYTFFYFPALLMASAAMAAYIGGGSTAYLAQDRTFLVAGSFGLLFVAVALNIVGLNIGKWLQNVGVGHSFHLAEHDADVGLGYGEFLAADCVCVCGPGALRDDERRSAQPPENFAARDFWFGDFNCADLYRGNFCGAFHVASRCGRSQERRVSGFDVRIDDAADCFVWGDRGDSGDGRECGRRWRNGGGSGARAVCGGN
jgi:hypothetical protein